MQFTLHRTFQRGGGLIPPETDGATTWPGHAPLPQTEPASEAPETPEAIAKPTPVRLVSLDAFRGLTILMMLLVNNISLGAHTPDQLMHADWSGEVHLADLVFPWFLFIVGVAVPYAAASARRKHMPTWRYDLKALYRAGALVFLGCLIDSALAKHVVIDLGVLQVIGLAYFVTVLIGGLLSLPGRLAFAALLLAGHWAIIRFASVGNIPAGHFGENDNVIDAINQTYLAPYHLKGLLSVIPTTAMVLLGTAVGDLVRRKKISSWAKVGILTICGAGLVAAGHLWSHELPMNKPLWTGSYILFTGGWACIGLAVMYLLVDMTPGRWGAIAAFPLIVFGMNAIVAYVVPILTKAVIFHNVAIAGTTPGSTTNLETAMQEWCYAHAGRIPGGWYYTLGYIAVWWLVLLFLYRKRWFLRV